MHITNFNVVGGPNASAYPVVHRIGPADLKDALAKGIADFWAIPSSIIFLSFLSAALFSPAKLRTCSFRS